MSVHSADSQQPHAVCSQLTAAHNSPQSPPSRLANANNNSNRQNGIEVKSPASPHRRKANIMLNGVIEVSEAYEEEEEEEVESLASPVLQSPSPGHHSEKESRLDRLQELHPGQFPMSGDLPTLDQGMPSPTLGFDLSSCSEHEGTASPPISPNSPSSASYGSSSKLDSSHAYTLPSTPSTISPSSTPSSPLLHIHNTIIHSGGVLAGSPTPVPLPHSFLLPYSQRSNTTCSQMGTAVSESSEHMMDEGEEEADKPHMCLWNNCNAEFAGLSSLVTHLDRGHTASMVHYVCQWKDCPRELKPFDARYKLVTHLRCHTGEKPYKCDVHGCTRSFSRLENLKLHVRTHTGEKPYICHYEKCNKRFNNTSDRAKHMKTHITRKPYACKVPGCGKSYTDPSSMRKHVKFAHRTRETHMEGGGAGTTWGGYQSPKKPTSPITVPSSSLLGSAGVVQTPQQLFLHHTIPTLPASAKMAASLSPPNRLSVIQSDSHHPSSSSTFSVANVPSTLRTQRVGMPSNLAVSPTTSIVPVSVIPVQNTISSSVQQPSVVTAAPTTPHILQPVLMQVDGTQQIVYLVQANSMSATIGGAITAQPETSGLGSRKTSHSDLPTPRNQWHGMQPYTQVLSGAPSHQTVFVSANETFRSRITSSSQQQQQQQKLHSSTTQGQESSGALKQQVHMKIAHLQNRMLPSQTYFQQLPSSQSSPSTLGGPERQVAGSSLWSTGVLRKHTTFAGSKAEALSQHVSLAQQTPAAPLILSTLGQGIVVHPMQLSPQVAQYLQPTSIVQLPHLAPMNVAQTHSPTAITPTTSSAAPFAVKPLTIVTPTQMVGLQTVVLPNGQLVSVVPSSTATTSPHVLIPPVTPQSTVDASFCIP